MIKINNDLIIAVEHYLADKLSQAFPYEEQSDGSRVFEIPAQEVIETVEGTEVYAKSKILFIDLDFLDIPVILLCCRIY